MPGRKDTSQAFVRSPLRHSLRELSSHKKQQSGSLPDFTQFTAGKNKNVNLNANNSNNNNNVDKKSNLSVVMRVPVTAGLPEPSNNNISKDDGDDLMYTQSETSLTASSNTSLGDGYLEEPVVRRRSSSTDNLRMKDEQQKPRLRDSAEGLDHKHFLVRGLCLGSYPLFHKGKK